MTETSADKLHIPSTPRPVTRRVSLRSWAEEPVQLWWKSSLLVVVVMAYVTFAQVRNHLREKDLMDNGAPVKAQIVELNGRTMATGSYHPTRENELPVKLSGVLPDGRVFLYAGMLPKAEGYAELGGELQLRVDPNDLTRYAEVHEQRALWHEFMAMFLLLPVLVILLGVAQWRRIGVLKVWRDGRARDGVVVGCKHSSMAPRSHICRYTIRESSDRRVFRMLYPSKYGVPREGDVLKLLVLPEQPQHAIVADFYVRSVEIADGAA